MRRRLVAAALPVTAVAFAWASLEAVPVRGAFLAVAVVALLTVVPGIPRVRLAAAVGALAVLVLLVAGRPATAWHVGDRGLRDFYAVGLPFDRLAHHEMHVLVVLAAAVFCLVIALTADGRPFVAAAATAAGVGWPATIMPTRNTVAMGALGLLAALWPLAVSAARDRRGLVPGAAVLATVVVVAALVAGAGARPSTAALDWENWDLFSASRAGETVSLVWNSDYGGIDFPAGKTTVLRIHAPRRSLYWRATTLDSFTGERWVEALYGTAVGGGDATLPRDDLLPPAASSGRDWVEQQVDVRALVDDHIVAAGQPMRLAAGSDRRVSYLSSGVMRARDPERDQLRHYTVWSYAPRPSPAALVRSPAHYPRSLARYLDVGRTIVPPFGVTGRAAAIDAVFGNQLYQELWPYKGMWREARRLTAKTRSPYVATVTIERWLRSDGGFTYDEHPPAAVGPPLVAFLERTKRGYCQQFAGTMALMLRYLGIPARVAVGFTSGTWKDGTWTVTDHEAHAWVEAWFAGYGWLTFDPTPGRGTLSATYTNASDSADAIRALGTGRFLDFGAGGPVTSKPGLVRPQTQAPSDNVPWWLGAPLVLAAAAILALAVAKAARRRRGYAGGDPRRRAAAARAELAAFIRDQGAAVAGTASVDELVLELRRLGVGTDAFAGAFARGRYGPPAVTARGADDARTELRRVLSILRSRLGFGRRIRGFFSVRSLRSG